LVELIFFRVGQIFKFCSLTCSFSPIFRLYSRRKRRLSAILNAFFNIMHHTVQDPFNIDLVLAAPPKAIHALLNSNIGKHRLHHA